MPRLCVERKTFFFLFSLGIRRGEHVGSGEVKGKRPMGGKSLRAMKEEEQGSLRREEREREGRHGGEEGQHETESLFYSAGSAS